eukprot:evm.model.NODE_31363_length_8911_cov_30.647739.2
MVEDRLDLCVLAVVAREGDDAAGYKACGLDLLHEGDEGATECGCVRREGGKEELREGRKEKKGSLCVHEKRKEGCKENRGTG